MKAKRPSAKYLARAQAFAAAVDLGIELSAVLPARERAAMMKSSLEWKEMALAPRSGFATTRSLAFLEEAFFTYWNESTGNHVEQFWQRVEKLNLPFERKNAVRCILNRGCIKNELEYEQITDAMVIQRQLKRISQAEEERLCKMLAQFEKRVVKRRNQPARRK